MAKGVDLWRIVYCYLKPVEQTVEFFMISDAMTLMWRHCNDALFHSSQYFSSFRLFYWHLSFEKDRPSYNEVTLGDMGKLGRYQMTTKRNCVPNVCIFVGGVLFPMIKFCPTSHTDLCILHNVI